MGRLLRICPIDVPEHVIQRGNNHQICFTCQQDFIAYVGWLKEYSIKYQVKIHAWVLMTNHVHLLCTPSQPWAVSHMMQDLGRQYVRYFNTSHMRSGTLWEGRYKSCLVQTESYLLKLYRYIELNPVRAGMVTQPADYFWSSYQINAIGKESDLCSPHPLYLSLGETKAVRLQNYRALFSVALDGTEFDEIRSATNKNLAVGDSEFKYQLELLTGRRFHSQKAGRPVGWSK